MIKSWYRYQKESVGYSIWRCSPYTGDKKDLVADARTERDAKRLCNRLNKEEEKRDENATRNA